MNSGWTSQDYNCTSINTSVYLAEGHHACPSVPELLQPRLLRYHVVSADGFAAMYCVKVKSLAMLICGGMDEVQILLLLSLSVLALGCLPWRSARPGRTFPSITLKGVRCGRRQWCCSGRDNSWEKLKPTRLHHLIASEIKQTENLWSEISMETSVPAQCMLGRLVMEHFRDKSLCYSS